MLNSHKLAKLICERFVGDKVLPKDVDSIIATMIENHVLNEINKYVNTKNAEDFNKTWEKPMMPKQDTPGIDKVQVWGRR